MEMDKVEKVENDINNDESSLALFAMLDLDILAKEALASLFHWTFIGKEEQDDAWSPPMADDTTKSSKKKKNNKKKMSKEEDEVVVSSPLLSFINVCGSVAKLLLEQNTDIEDGDFDSMASLFDTLFLSLGAHIRSGKTSQLVDAVSNAALAELLQLFHNDEGTSYASVTDLITNNSISQQVLTLFFSKEKMSETVAVPNVLQLRCLWFALESYSDLLATKFISSRRSVSGDER